LPSLRPSWEFPRLLSLVSKEKERREVEASSVNLVGG
jgi:hypothetical protein